MHRREGASSGFLRQVEVVERAFAGSAESDGVDVGRGRLWEEGVEAVLDKDDFRQGDLGEVGALGEPKAEEAVGVLDGAVLPGGVGVGVVDGGAEDAFEGGLVEELAAVAFRLRLRSVAIGSHGADCATARLARTVAQTVLGQDDDAVFEVVVDGALRGETFPALEAERAQAGGDGEALREEGDETHGEEIGHHGAALACSARCWARMAEYSGQIQPPWTLSRSRTPVNLAFSSRCSRLYERRYSRVKARMLNALRPRLTFLPQSFYRATRPSFIQCSPTRGNALHALMSAFFSDLMFCLSLILAATPTFFIPSLRPPGGTTRAFFLLPSLDPFYCATSRGVGGVGCGGQAGADGVY